MGRHRLQDVPAPGSALGRSQSLSHREGDLGQVGWVDPDLDLSTIGVGGVHHLADATGVVEMTVRADDPLDLGLGPAKCLESADELGT